MKLSACWIVKNEEQNLVRSIESLCAAVDELVVVDTGSEDATVQTARGLGAVVHRFEWINDFSAARNYALEQCAGELIIFLDADEWFSPALTLKDREGIEKLFKQSPKLDCVQLPGRNLTSAGEVKTVGMYTRILRKRPNCRYRNKIHEQYKRADGSAPNTMVSESWSLNHSGYVEDVFESKMRRNIEMLEISAQTANDEMERLLSHCYLVREYLQVKEMENCLRHLKVVLKNPAELQSLHQHYSYGLVPLTYTLIAAAAQLRQHTSRREVMEKLIRPFKKHFRDYAGSATIELFYDCLFDRKEDILLANIGPSIEAARKKPHTPLTYHLNAEKLLNHCAAEASLLRGKPAQAMDYALESLKISADEENASSLRVLLQCVKGQPPQDIVLFLNSQFDTNDSQKLAFLVESTRMEGFQDVHVYYLDKKIQSGTATKGDYLFLLLMLKKYGESVDASHRFMDEKNSSVVRRHWFLAAICSGDREIFHQHKSQLAGYDRVLDAFFANAPLSSPTNAEIELLLSEYDLIAFAAGLEAAVRFAAVFSAQPLLCSQLRARYCVRNAMYDTLVRNKSELDQNDFLSTLYLIECEIMRGQHKIALELLRPQLLEGNANAALLRQLLAIANTAPPELSSQAQALYTAHSALFDWMVDLQDFVSTGYVPLDVPKTDIAALRSMQPAQLDEWMAQDAAKPPLQGLAELCEKAGALYENRDMPAQAAPCYRFALSKGANLDDNRKNLARVFASLGNTTLAAALSS